MLWMYWVMWPSSGRIVTQLTSAADSRKPNPRSVGVDESSGSEPYENSRSTLPVNNEDDLAQDLRLRDRTPAARVYTIVAVIADEEVFMWAEADGLMGTVLAFARREGDPVAVLLINARSDAVNGATQSNSARFKGLSGNTWPSMMTRFSLNSRVSPGRPMTRLAPMIGKSG
jgi:hypothetical protein